MIHDKQLGGQSIIGQANTHHTTLSICNTVDYVFWVHIAN